MNAQVQPLPSRAARPLEVVVTGRVESVHRYEDKTYTKVLCPAVDAYSKPSLLNLRSARSVGRKGEEITVTCLVGGFARRAYEAKNRETGEIERVVPVEHTLDVIEG